MSKDIKKALEHCIEWNCVECPNREELGSGETVCRGRLLPEVLEYVADLEAKLAESQKNFVVANNLRKNADEVLLNYKTEKYGLGKTIQELRKMKLSLPEKEWYYKGFENCERQMSSHIADLALEVKELKQQLAESENQCRECKHLNKKIELNIKNKLMAENRELQKQLAEKEKRCEICGSKMILGELGYYCNNDELHPIYQAPNEAKSDYEKITLLKQDYDAMVEREELLRQQLTKKEKEIEKLTEELDYKNYCNDFC